MTQCLPEVMTILKMTVERYALVAELTVAHSPCATSATKKALDGLSRTLFSTPIAVPKKLDKENESLIISN